MNLETPEKIRTLQRKLYRKAKAEPAYRFYVLYDKICREDILHHAYRLARSNAGAPGVDGVSFAQIEERGLEAWLASLREELVSKTYRPDPVRRVMIPKPNGGGERALGIPTIRDRVVQTAAKLVLEPIFEADFEDNAYGYRPARGAVDAVKEVHRHICRLLAPKDPLLGIERRYRPGTLVLETEFQTETGSAAVIDFMVPADGANLVRTVTGRSGRVVFQTELVVRFNYGATVPWVSRLADDTAITSSMPKRWPTCANAPWPGLWSPDWPNIPTSSPIGRPGRRISIGSASRRSRLPLSFDTPARRG
jgi:hypothetical protein